MLPFAFATLLGAFLLFLIQPLIGRYVLPWFGGAPGVWTTCLLFFQSALLAGYAYAHLLTRCVPPRRQALWHLGLLVGALAWLPPLPAADWKPSAEADPTGRLLGLLATTLGPLFVLLAATGPLLQRWFSSTFPDRSPYRLYALSNAGSLLALLGYPIFIEPRWTRAMQAGHWSVGFGVFVVLVGWLAWITRSVAPPAATTTIAAESAAPGWGRHCAWLGWPALGSGLLLATTNALTLDVAAAPFLWIAPLAVYLLSFIAAFAHPRWYQSGPMAALLVASAALLLDLRSAGTGVTFAQLMVTYLATLLVVTLLCHGEVYRLRPAASQLTSFYLHIAAGGAAGSFAVAVVAPRWFNSHLELPLGWCGVLLVQVARMWRQRDLTLARGLGVGVALTGLAVPAFRVLDTWFTAAVGGEVAESIRGFAADHPLVYPLGGLGLLITFGARSHGYSRNWTRRAGMGASVLPLLVAGWWLQRVLRPDPRIIHQARSFYGVHSVADYDRDTPASACRYLAHGSTTHGIQLLDPAYAQWPTSYYAPESGLGLAFFRTGQHPHRQVGVLGLGIGTIAAYGAAGDDFTFFEIDPVVAGIARRYFTFLSASAATVHIVLGDGRLSLARAAAAPAPARFDLLVLDAFASDAVPVHLLTREAFDLYQQCLAPGGVIAVNISNCFVDLATVISAQAHAKGWYVARVYHRPPDDAWYNFASEWMLLAPDEATLNQPAITAVATVSVPAAEAIGVTWTDEYASLWPVLR